MVVSDKMLPDDKQSRACLAFFEAFTALLNEKSYEDISVSDIVARADFSRSAFYVLFENKDDLLRKLMEYQNVLYIRATRSAYLFQADKIDGSFYYPMLSVYTYAYKNREFFHLLFKKAMPGYDLVAFCMTSQKFFRKTFEVKIESKPESLDWDMYWFTSGMNILNFVVYWDRMDWIYSPEYMAKNAALLMAPIKNLEVGCSRTTIIRE